MTELMHIPFRPHVIYTVPIYKNPTGAVRIHWQFILAIRRHLMYVDHGRGMEIGYI